MVGIFEAMFVTGLLIGSTRFNTRITVWFRESIPLLDRFNIPLASALVVIGFIGILMTS